MSLGKPGFLIKLCFLSLVAISGIDARLLGEKECTYGPSFWCGSLKQAKQCDAVKHCIQTVWETQILPKDNDFVCTTCKDMVQAAREQLESKDFQNAITNVVRTTCDIIPIKEIQKDCYKLSDELIPEFIEMLVSQMNPQIICATVHLCNSVAVDKLIDRTPVNVNINHEDTQSDCKDCKTFVDDIKKNIKQGTRQEVLHKLLAICGRMDSLSDGCKAIVEVNFPAIYDYILNDLQSQQVCDMMGFCSKYFGATLVKLAHKSDDKPCEYCEAIVDHWKHSVMSRTTRNEFKQILNSICDQTGGFRAECRSLVDQYYIILYDILISEIQPKEICDAVGMCGTTSVFNENYPVWTLFNMKPSDHIAPISMDSDIDVNTIVGMDEKNSYKNDKAIRTSSLGESGILKKDSTECVMCEFAMHYLQNVLQDKPTRKEIEHELDTLCSKLPHSISEQCTDYVDAYGDEVIQLIILEIDPNTICPMLHFCPSKVQKRMKDPEIPCVMCEFAMTQIEEILKDHKTEESIKNAFEHLCEVMPKSIESDCRNFVDQYAEEIIQMLINDVKPSQICSQIGLCPNAKTPTISAIDFQLPLDRMFVPSVNRIPDVKTYHQSTYCAVCEFVISELDKFMLLPTTEDKVTKALEKICFVLPHTLMKDCTSFIDLYSNEITALLVGGLKPEEVCSAVRLCKPTPGYTSEIANVIGKSKREVLLGSKKCTYGPGYWCASKENAASCGEGSANKIQAINHCKENVWGNQN